MQSPADLDEPYIRALIAKALSIERVAFAKAAPLQTIIKSVSAKQKPRRPTRPAAVASARGGRTKSTRATGH
jgi:hypothetical protein